MMITGMVARHLKLGMWNAYEPWQLKQLEQLAKSDPERVEKMLNSLWNAYPALYDELAVAAVDQHDLSIDECAVRMDVPVEEVEDCLQNYRGKSLSSARVVVFDGDSQVARLADSQIPVWEIVRQYRKIGSVEKLAEAFPTLTTTALAAGLRYAEQNPREIEALIAEYETRHDRLKAQYPFSK